MATLFGRIGGTIITADPYASNMWIVMGGSKGNAGGFSGYPVSVRTLEDAAGFIAIQQMNLSFDQQVTAIQELLRPDYATHTFCRCGSGDCACECKHEML